MKTVLIHLSENKELKRYFCLLITGLLCFAVYAQERAHVVIVAGQSNTDGRVPVSDLPEYIRSMENLFLFGLVVIVGAMMLLPIICWNSCIKKTFT